MAGLSRPMYRKKLLRKIYDDVSWEFAKLRALRARVPYVPTSLTCLRALVP